FARAACASTTLARAVSSAALASLTCCWSSCCLSDDWPRARAENATVATSASNSAAKGRSRRMGEDCKQHQQQEQQWPQELKVGGTTPFAFGRWVRTPRTSAPRLGPEEPAQADGGADDADHDADEQHQEGDPGRVAGGHEELAEEAVAVVERLVEAPVLQRRHRDDGEAGADEALHHALG